VVSEHDTHFVLRVRTKWYDPFPGISYEIKGVHGVVSSDKTCQQMKRFADLLTYSSTKQINRQILTASFTNILSTDICYKRVLFSFTKIWKTKNK
jgi:hypothetical protein